MDKKAYCVARDGDGEDWEYNHLTVTYGFERGQEETYWEPGFPSTIEIIEVVDENGKNFELTEKEKKEFYEEFWRDVEFEEMNNIPEEYEYHRE